MPLLTTRTGRRLSYRVDGPPSGDVLVFCTGTPQGTVEDLELTAAAAAAGLRLVTYDRPGYGGSQRAPGRVVRDAVDDIAELLDALEVERFVVAGHSGGGPHALACGVLLSDRCRAVALLAGVAPYDAEGLDFLDGMGPENVEEFGAAVEGESALRPLLEQYEPELRDVTAAGVIASMEGLLPGVDQAVLTGSSYGEVVAARFRAALASGVDGWLDDDLAFVRPWGFDLADVTVPVSVWQGSEDLMVPFAHGQWLVEHLPTARAHLLQGEGHLSVVVGRIGDVLAELTV